jgi:hypothetical protein
MRYWWWLWRTEGVGAAVAVLETVVMVLADNINNGGAGNVAETEAAAAERPDKNLPECGSNKGKKRRLRLWRLMWRCPWRQWQINNRCRS